MPPLQLSMKLVDSAVPNEGLAENIRVDGSGGVATDTLWKILLQEKVSMNSIVFKGIYFLTGIKGIFQNKYEPSH